MLRNAVVRAGRTRAQLDRIASLSNLQHNNVYILALTTKNSNVTAILVFLERLVEVRRQQLAVHAACVEPPGLASGLSLPPRYCVPSLYTPAPHPAAALPALPNNCLQIMREYFGVLEEESIRDNFVLVYELLDEVCDHGYPQITEVKVLKEYITQGANKLAVVKPPQAVTNAVSWRMEGIKYKKNEVFLDVVERLNLLMAANGNVLSSEILGAVKMRSYLSGMPELKLGLNDKALFEAQGKAGAPKKAVEMEDIKFHQCVRLTRFETDRTISFIPPDGEFELMSYRLNTTVKPLVWVETVIESHGRSRVEYMVKAKSNFKPRSIANNVEILIPVPPDVDTPAFKASMGTVTYVPDLECIRWSIKAMYGGKEAMMKAHFGLPSVTGDEADSQKWRKKAIQVRFEIPYFTVSGIQVRVVPCRCYVFVVVVTLMSGGCCRAVCSSATC